MKKEKIYYIDNLRVFLMILVVLHHSLITYGAPGGWYYTQKTTHTGALIPMTFLVAVNQSFFMGFFFFLSALFIGPSLDRKGTRQFIIDRLIRLGIPLVFYSLMLSPFVSFLVYRFGEDHDVTFAQYISGYHHWIEFGVLWFVAALLLFIFVYLLIRRVFPKSPVHQTIPRNGIIFWFAVATGFLSYLVRIFFPIGWILHPVGFQLAYFSQYISLFTLGIIAARNRWLESFTIQKSKPFLILAAIFVFAGLPFLFVIRELTHSPMEAYSGEGSLLSLLLAVWEQVTGISIMVVLLGYGRALWNKQNALLHNMTRSAYAVYIFHPLVLVSLALLFRNAVMDPAIKLLFVAPLAVIGSFILGAFLVKLPVVKNII